ncbi:MAG: M13 family metallopeptidase N-terminal domain-containing protein, partial [Myxococcota bacterium]
MSRVAVSTIGLPLAVAFACNPGPTATPPQTPGGASPAGETTTLSAEVHAVMDEQADPCVDFFRYACGQWLDETEIPGHESRYGRFNALREHNQDALHQILEAAVAEPNPDADTARLAAFYGACMDLPAVEARGMAGLTERLSQLEAIKDADSLMAAVGQLHRDGVQVLFDFGVSSDYDQPDINIVHLSQGGLGLPDRDYYLRPGEPADALRKAYVAHIEALLSLSRHADAQAAAARVMAFETQLAEASLPRDQLRDPNKRHHEVDAKGLAKLTPGLRWGPYFETLGTALPPVLNVSPESFMASMAELVGDRGPKKDRTARRTAVKDYLRWQVLHAAAPHLTPAFVDAHFAFYDQKLRGQAEPTPRWKRCVDLTDRALGESLGQGFVAEHFAGESKDIALSMIEA